MSDASQKAKANISQFLKSLDNAYSDWEDGDFSEPDRDDNDGIEIRKPNQIVADQAARTLALRKHYSAQKALFTQSEIEEDASLLVKDDDIDLDPSHIDYRGKYGYTKLHEAAIAGDLEGCKRLVEQGSSLIVVDNSGRMAWQKAAAFGYEEIAQLLKPKND